MFFFLLNNELLTEKTLYSLNGTQNFENNVIVGRYSSRTLNMVLGAILVVIVQNNQLKD